MASSPSLHQASTRQKTDACQSTTPEMTQSQKISERAESETMTMLP